MNVSDGNFDLPVKELKYAK